MSDDNKNASGNRDPKPRRKPEAMRRVREHVIAKVRDVEARASQSEQKRVQVSLDLWRFCTQVFRQWQRDRCPQQAASLSYQLLLSIVPALAVIFAAFRVTGAMGAESMVISFLTTELIPLSAADVSEKLLYWSSNINIESMGIVGLITTLLIAFVTFNSMDQAISLIWRVETRRSLPKRLATFYATATLGPLVFGFSLYPAAQFGLTSGWSGAFLSALISFCGLFLANYLLPATPVKVRAAVIGAAVNTVAFELAKLAFAAYVGNFAMDKYAGIYGTVAIVPLSLVWIYWSWLMFLLGIEVTHTVQNYHLLEPGRRSQMSLSNEFENRVNARMALDLSVRLAHAQAAGDSGCSLFRLQTELSLSDDALHYLLYRLKEHKLVNENTTDRNWSLAGPAQDTSVQQIVDAFAPAGQLSIFGGPELSNESDGRQRAHERDLDAIVDHLIERARQPLEECSLHDLLSEST